MAEPQWELYTRQPDQDREGFEAWLGRNHDVSKYMQTIWLTSTPPPPSGPFEDYELRICRACRRLLSPFATWCPACDDVDEPSGRVARVTVQVPEDQLQPQGATS